MDDTLTFGSLFSGIGGLDLGLERAGMRCVWQVEINSYANKVLARHWPNVSRWGDVRTFPPEPHSKWKCDIIAGGFPCQDISNAGSMSGLSGKRSGLWSEFARIIRMVRPKYVLVENVAALADRGLGTVLRDVAALGYNAEWDCLPACALGAYHIRRRMFIVCSIGGMDTMSVLREFPLHDSPHARQRLRLPANRGVDGGPILDGMFGASANANSERCEKLDAAEVATGVGQHSGLAITSGNQWGTEPRVGRVAYGIPNRVDRLKCLGNAVVPQVAEWIGRRIIANHKKTYQDYHG